MGLLKPLMAYNILERGELGLKKIVPQRIPYELLNLFMYAIQLLVNCLTAEAAYNLVSPTRKFMRSDFEGISGSEDCGDK